MAKIKADINLTTEHTAIRIWAAEKAEKIKMQKALADIERKIIDKRMCGVTSSDIHDRLQPSRQSEETKLLFSLNSDQDYTKAKDLVSAYILEKNHLRLEIQRLYIGIQPLEELAKTESKKIKSMCLKLVMD